MMPDSTTVQLVTILLLLGVLVANSVVRRRVRAQRPISALSALPRMVNRSIETNRPLHLSLGGFSLGDQDTLLALAALDAFYPPACDLSLGDAAPLVTLGSTSTLQVARDMLRRAHRAGKAASQRRVYDVRWYPDAGFALAGAFSVINHDDKVAGHVITDRGGAELALPLWGAEMSQTPTIVAAMRPPGQAVAYALADHVLLGEELFAVPGYLEPAGSLHQRTMVVDIVRLLVVLLLIAVFSLNVLGWM